MLSIIMEAKHIPDGTAVRKVTGVKPYTLKRELKLYKDKPAQELCGAEAEIVDVAPGIMFLLAQTVSCIVETQKLAVDFLDIESARDWLRWVEDE